MKQLLKLIAAIMENLPEMSPETIQRWIEAPEVIRDGLAKMFSQTPLKVWKTIKLVAYQSADQCRQALEKAGCRISDWAKDLLGKIDFTKSVEEEVKFGKLTVGQLGLTRGGTLRQILARIVELGLAKCEPYDGPNVRVQSLDQPMGEGIFMAMDPITASRGYPHVFVLRRRGDGLWLHAHCYSLDFFFRADICFLFRLPCK